KNYVDLNFAKVDLLRKKIKGYPEVIFCKGKTVKQIIEIMKVLAENRQKILATKANKQIYSAVKKIFSNAVYCSTSKVIMIKNGLGNSGSKKKKKGKILIMSAGTSDIPIAEEAALTAEFLDNRVERLYDVGVAGLHRLLSNIKKVRSASVIIITAGMEGALASVVSGLTDKPIIAVPTNVGYGSHFNGIAPLLGMLNTCSPGVVVVNIDNGFGAGYFASMINR
ncbi:nickel pincer cofactor biosynthesis protein LarB, partial [Candidatus Micrarchaeota archaeon]|nr:nickel pincer cofactor biosynthesis protein LarB [Candidatus Micrarchaeota archaeon]